MKKNLKLFMTFFKIGLFTFGGGYAMISIIYKESVEKNNWISEEDMNNIIVIAESTPGPIAINSATFIGYKVGKFWGAFLSVLGVVLPSFIIITLISIFYEYFRSIAIIQYAFEGIRAAIVILMVEALIKLAKPLKKNAIFYSLIISSLILNYFFGVSAFFLILIAVVIGIFRELFFDKKVNLDDWTYNFVLDFF